MTNGRLLPQNCSQNWVKTLLLAFICLSQVSLNAQTYCPSKGNLPWQEWIAGVKFGTINNTSIKEGYGDFTAQTTALSRGTSYPLSITQGFSYAPDAANATQQGKVWIDYNQNKTFETTELVASFTRTTTTANVVIPTTALLGATRMRVSLKTTGAPTACEVFDKGEVEDYTVNIGAGGVDPCLTDVTPPVFQNCPKSDTIFNNIVCGASGPCGGFFTWTPPTATDNCTANPVIAANYQPGEPFVTPNGKITINYTATDAKGNIGRCSFTRTYINISTCSSIAPLAFTNCPTNINLTTTGDSAVATWTAPTLVYVCGQGSTSSNFVSGQKFPVGTTQIVVRGFDAYRPSQSATCTFQITVTRPTTGRDNLRILNVTGPDALPQGGTVTLNVTFKNTGTAPSVAGRKMGIYETSQYQGDFYKWYDVTKESNLVAIGQSIAPNATVTVPMTFQLSSTFTSKSPLPTKGTVYKGKLIAFDNMPLGQQDFPFSGGVDTLYLNLPTTSFVDLPNGDLSVEILAPDTTFGGDNVIKYSVRVRNLSTQTARNVQSTVYAFTRAAGGALTSIIRPSKGTVESVSPFPSETVRNNWTIGDMAAGEIATCTVEFIQPSLGFNRSQPIVVDVQSNQLDEINTTNNLTFQDFTFSTTKPRAELSVSNLRLTPSVARQTDSITVSVDIKNTGNLSANNFTVGVYLRLNANDSTGGYSPSGYFNGFGSISVAPNASMSLTKRFGLTTSIPEGNYFLQIFADDSYTIGEVNESNNRISTPLQISNQVQNTCRFQDSLQLVSLYNATNGANWTNKWNLATPINTWYGVSLNADGCVTNIIISTNNLVGQLPNLTLNSLSQVSLSFNKLSGTLPTFSKAPNLTYLNLSENQFTGNLPNWNLPYLRVISLVRNQLTGTIPIFNTPSLVEIGLSGNKLMGNIPNFSYPDLQYLEISFNQMSGTIPNFNLPKLTYLQLNSNLLTGNIPNFNLPLLNTLFLDNNQLSGCLPLSLKTYCGKTVDFSNNVGLSNQNFATFCSSNLGACTSGSSNQNIGVSLGNNGFTYRQFTNFTFQIGAINYNSQPFTNVKIEFKFPAKTVSGGTAVPTVGTWQEWCSGGIQCFTWTIPTLGANTTALLDIPLFILDATGPIVFKAKLLSSTPLDTNPIDDIITVTLNPATAPAQAPPTQALAAFQVPTQLIPVVIQRIAPNPTEGDVVIRLDSWKQQEVDFNFSDITGKTIHSEKRQLEKGVNKVEFDLYHLPQGVYFIQTNVGKGRHVPTKFVKM
jgi:hypothetical protein